MPGLRVERGGHLVLPGLDLNIERGKVTGVLGPSGGGKSTLLRCLVGVQRIVAGEVSVCGLPAGDPALRRRVGYVTQSPSVYRDLTVRENTRYFAAVAGADASDADRAIAQVDLTDQADRLVGRLSGGQLSRVSLAAALVGMPEVLVLDEPTVGLDPVLRRDLWRLFHRLAESGTTVVVSSHVMDEARRCDRLVLLREGRILADDSPAGILAATGTTDAESAFLALIERATLEGRS